MIFALLDYRAFRRGTGRYADAPTSRLFACFDDGLPAGVVALLETGDAIFTSDLRSALSWMIRYVTGSDFSHVALVLGPGMIQEMNLGGIAVKRMEELRRPHLRLLPVHGPYSTDQRAAMGTFLERTRHARYATAATLFVAVKILCCYYPHSFRFAFIVDIAMLLLTCDLISLELFRFPVLIWLLLPYLAAVAYLYVTWRFLDRAVPATPMPDTLFFGLLSIGGTGFLNGAALRNKTRRSDGTPMDFPDVVPLRALPPNLEPQNGR